MKQNNVFFLHRYQNSKILSSVEEDMQLMLCCSVAPHIAYTNASTQSSVSCSFIMNVLKVELIVHQEILFA